MSGQEFLSFNTDELAQVKPTATRIQIPTFNLVPDNHEILHKVVSKWDFSNPPLNANEFASSLVETCIKNRALGLSANQCGFNYRVFVAGHGDNYVAYFNPEVISMSDEVEIGPEGCLSFPHLFLNVVRPKSVSVEYQDYNGEKHTAIFEGLTARVFLHEYDHMEGIVFTSRAKPLALKSGLEKRNKLFHKMEKAQKQLSKLAKQQR
jgi:peptide deformylase